jgi:putative transposase
MILGHTIALGPTPEQAAYFRRACGRVRFAYDWEWQRMREAGEKPSTAAVKCRWNAHRKAELPWTYEVTKCASGRATMALGTAFANFLRDCKKPRQQRRFRYPRFKNKARKESFALWNDQFAMSGKQVRIAKLGFVRMREELRLVGKIMGATASFSGGRWFISVQVNTDEERVPAPKGTVCGVDLGSRALATIVDNEIEPVTSPKPRKRLLGRIKPMQRRVSLQKHRAKKAGHKASRRQFVRQLRLSKLHARLANIRKDAAHRLTTDLSRRFETIVIEDLNVWAKNHSLAGAALDCGLREIRRQFRYKQGMRGRRVCSCCGCLTGLKGREEMDVEEWLSSECGAEHTRDGNAAINLRKLGTAGAGSTRGDVTPLPAFLRMSASVAG